MKRRAAGVMTASIVLAGCGHHAASITDRHGTESDHVASLWWVMFAMAAAVYVLVATLVVVAVVRGRRRQRAVGEGGREDLVIWLGGLVLPVVVLSVLGTLTVTTARAVRAPSADALAIHVSGERWWWDVDYPASGVRTANEIRVPVGQPIDITLTSDNVIHSFWVPSLAGKVDVVPGQTNHLRLKANDAGTYRGQCAEYCGIQHANMAFVVIAESPADFERWLTRRTSGAGLTPTDDQAAQGQRVFEREACAGCHTVAGTTAQGTTGPDLSDFGERHSIAALTVANTPQNLHDWIADPQSIKPGNLMPTVPLGDADIDKVVAYLENLK